MPILPNCSPSFNPWRTIESARRYYDAVVRDYNILIESFPSNLIASGFKFEKSDFFELQSPETERQPVKVSF